MIMKTDCVYEEDIEVERASSYSICDKLGLNVEDLQPIFFYEAVSDEEKYRTEYAGPGPVC